jgi:hypothetical protein
MEDSKFELGEYSAALILNPNKSGMYPNFSIDVKLYVPKNQEEKVPEHMLAISELAHMINNNPDLVSTLAQRAKNRIKGYKIASAEKLLLLTDETEENDDEELYDADPNCKHKIVSSGFSGVVCKKCKGWFCY